jgi:hypothetical protein
MANDLTPQEPEADDGFHGSLTAGRLLKGTFIKWTDADHWKDRDGLTPPSPLLVVAVDEALQKWKDKKPEVIRDKPLPNCKALNDAIPLSEWERGIDGKPREPWTHIVVVYLVDLSTGGFFTYASATLGGHIAFDALKEAVITMRALRGAKVMPVVNLDERPFKTSFGQRRRPHFAVVSWKTPGGEAKAVPAKPTPELTGPAAAAAPASAPVSTAANSAAAQPYQAKPKPAVNLGNETLAAMGDVKAVTASEVLDDELPF